MRPWGAVPSHPSRDRPGRLRGGRIGGLPGRPPFGFALAEALRSLCKAELILWLGPLAGYRRCPWSPPPSEATDTGTTRPHCAIGMCTPAEHEAAWVPNTDNVGQQTISQAQQATTGARQTSLYNTQGLTTTHRRWTHRIGFLSQRHTTSVKPAQTPSPRLCRLPGLLRRTSPRETICRAGARQTSRPSPTRLGNRPRKVQDSSRGVQRVATINAINRNYNRQSNLPNPLFFTTKVSFPWSSRVSATRIIPSEATPSPPFITSMMKSRD